ncbi:MFS transporter [Catellatospora sp. NPDC049609]|uniref:MFS transporter n=1 Tax=Catellatospora sp. NPDC049609 TaxID=3155505 RepID=UPI00343A5AC9
MTAAAVTPPAAPGWWTSRFGQIPGNGRRLLAGLGASRLGFVVVPFAAYWLANDRDLTAGQTAVVMTAFGAGWTFGVLAGGSMADRVGRKYTIIIANVLSAGAFLLLGAAPTLLSLCAAAAAAGFAFDLARPAVQALLADIVDAQSRAPALALLYWIMNLSRAASCVIGGLLAQHDFRLLFVLNALLNLAFAAVVAAVVAEPPRPVVGRGRGAWRSVLADRRMVGFTAVTLVFLTVHAQSMVTLPVVMDEAGIPPVWYGIVLAADPAAVVIAQLLLQRFIATLPAAKACAAGIAAVGAGLPLTAVGDSVGWFVATTPLWVAGEVVFLAIAPAVVAGLAPSDMRGAYFGVWGATMGVAALAAPVTALLLLHLGGGTLLWAGCVIAGAAAAAACLRMDLSPASAEPDGSDAR